MFVLRIRYNSAFLPSSPLNSIVATLDEITEGKEKVVYSLFSSIRDFMAEGLVVAVSCDSAFLTFPFFGNS